MVLRALELVDQGHGEVFERDLARAVRAVQDMIRANAEFPGALARSDDDRGLAAGDLPKNRRPLFLHVGVRRKIFKRQHIVGRKLEYAFCGDSAGKFASSAY